MDCGVVVLHDTGENCLHYFDSSFQRTWQQSQKWTGLRTRTRLLQSTLDTARVRTKLFPAKRFCESVNHQLMSDACCQRKEKPKKSLNSFTAPVGSSLNDR